MWTWKFKHEEAKHEEADHEEADHEEKHDCSMSACIGTTYNRHSWRTGLAWIRQNQGIEWRKHERQPDNTMDMETDYTFLLFR